MRSSGATRRHWFPSLAVWAIRLLHLYPSAWRERYADEVAAVLEDYPVTLWTLCDVALGALDVRLRSDLLPGRLTSMAHRIRSSEIVIFAAVIPFFVAWRLLFIASLLGGRYSHWSFLVSAHPALGVAMSTLDLAGFATLGVIPIAGIPLLLVVFWLAAVHHRWEVALLPVVAAILTAFVFDIAGFFWMWLRYHLVIGPLTAFTYVPGWIILGPVMMVAVGVCATIIINRTLWNAPSLLLMRVTLVPASLLAIAIAVGALGGLGALALISIEASQLGVPVALALVILLLLLVAFVMAAGSLWRGVRAAWDGVGAPITTV